MINGRVNERAAEKAARVLKREGLTVSAFIRNSIEFVARTNSVPESGLPPQSQPAGIEKLRGFVKAVEARPMPGRGEFAELSEDDAIERIRMERYGY